MCLTNDIICVFLGCSCTFLNYNGGRFDARYLESSPVQRRRISVAGAPIEVRENVGKRLQKYEDVNKYPPIIMFPHLYPCRTHQKPICRHLTLSRSIIARLRRNWWQVVTCFASLNARTAVVCQAKVKHGKTSVKYEPNHSGWIWFAIVCM